MDCNQLIFVEQTLRDIVNCHVEQIIQYLESREFICSFGKISATLLYTIDRSLSKLVKKESYRNFMEPSEHIGSIDRRNRCAAIYKILEVFLEVHGPHGWVHHRILISIVVRKDGGYIYLHDIINVRNQKNGGAKVTKQHLKFMEKLQKVPNYSITV